MRLGLQEGRCVREGGSVLVGDVTPVDADRVAGGVYAGSGRGGSSAIAMLMANTVQLSGASGRVLMLPSALTRRAASGKSVVGQELEGAGCFVIHWTIWGTRY